MTSASANKMLRQLNDEFQFLAKQESEKRTYSAIDGIQPIVPDYDLKAHRQKMNEVSGKIAKLKHAVNIFNVSTMLPECKLTIDEALVRMAFLSREKDRLDVMRCIPEKKLVTGYSMRNNQVEYECANYDPKEADALYAEVANQLSRLQLELDAVNATEVFEADI